MFEAIVATAVLAVAGPTLEANLRSAHATIALRASNSPAGAEMTYTVDGVTARLTLPPNDYGLTVGSQGFRLIDAAGIGYPLLLVDSLSCIRDCTEYPAFYRFGASPPSLAEVPQYSFTDDTTAKPAGPCFKVGAPQQLYTWTSTTAIQIRPEYRERYFAIRTNDGSFAIANTAFQYNVSSDAPQGTTAPVETPFAGQSVRVVTLPGNAGSVNRFLAFCS
jgi:hypothetical protein